MRTTLPYDFVLVFVVLSRGNILLIIFIHIYYDILNEPDPVARRSILELAGLPQ